MSTDRICEQELTEASHSRATLNSGERPIDESQMFTVAACAFEAREPIRLGDAQLREHPDSDDPAELRVGGPADVAHPARTRRRTDPARTEQDSPPQTATQRTLHSGLSSRRDW